MALALFNLVVAYLANLRHGVVAQLGGLNLSFTKPKMALMFYLGLAFLSYITGLLSSCKALWSN